MGWSCTYEGQFHVVVVVVVQCCLLYHVVVMLYFTLLSEMSQLTSSDPLIRVSCVYMYLYIVYVPKHVFQYTFALLLFMEFK